MAHELVNTQANFLRLVHVEKCFGNSVTLRKQGRVLLGEGVLTKVCRKNLKPRVFFLFNDVLVYGTIVLDKKKYSKPMTLPLDDIAIVLLPDTDDMRNAWQITSTKRSFTLFAATSRERGEWVQHLAQASGCPLITNPEDRLPSHAPAWVPDNHASECLHCRRLGRVKKFTTFNRRHHCRYCGLVVCGACSSHKFLLESQSSKPLRVCDTCFTKLSADFREKMQRRANEEPSAAGGAEGGSTGAAAAADSPSPKSPGRSTSTASDASSITAEDSDDGDDDGGGGPSTLKEASATLSTAAAEHPSVFFDDDGDGGALEGEADGSTAAADTGSASEAKAAGSTGNPFA